MSLGSTKHPIPNTKYPSINRIELASVMTLICCNLVVCWSFGLLVFWPLLVKFNCRPKETFHMWLTLGLVFVGEKVKSLLLLAC